MQEFKLDSERELKIWQLQYCFGDIDQMLTKADFCKIASVTSAIGFVAMDIAPRTFRRW
jgi:hypothetical protein